MATTHSKCWALIAALLLGSVALGQTITVKEYYNKALDAYFLTGRTSEQNLLATIADFQATGMSFQATAASANPTAADPIDSICRFYVTAASPYTNSHFYGAFADCTYLLSLRNPNFHWEGYDFATRVPANGTCPVGTTTVYRGFRQAANGKTSNHRYTTAKNYIAAQDGGWAPEGPSLCVASATDATSLPLVVSGPPIDCGTVYYPGKQFTYVTSTTVAPITTTQWFRTYSETQTAFNGRLVAQVIDSYNDGSSVTTMLDEATTTWTNVGTSSKRIGDTFDRENYSLPAITYPRQMAIGQSVNVDRELGLPSPFDSFNTFRRGKMTLLGTESVTVTAGTFDACKLQWDENLTARSPFFVRQFGREITTVWIAPRIGMVKTRLQGGNVDTAEVNMVTTVTEASQIR